MLGGLFGKKKSAAGDFAPEHLSPALTSTILGVVGGRSIPTMPAAAQKAFQLSTNPKAEARDFIEVIESDEALAARVIKIANSVYFDRGKASKTIEDSVVVIGINELRNLLSATTLSEIFPSSHRARSQLWENDIGTAVIAKSLAQMLLPSQTEVAFLGGLMHDIGKLLLLQRSGGEYQKVLEQVERSGANFCEAEAQSFPFDHTEVGQLIAERWNFSPELVAIIRWHHQPWATLSRSGVVGLPLIVRAADTIAHALGIGHPRGFARFKENCVNELGAVWTHLRIPASSAREHLDRFQRAYESERDLYAGGRS